MDPGIKDEVTAFNVLGIPTYKSCEGHVEERFGKWRYIYPYVSVGYDEPKFRYVDEEAIRMKIEQETGEPIDRKLEKVNNAMRAFWKTTDDAQETDEYIAVREKNQALEIRVNALLTEFYNGRETVDAVRLTTDGVGPIGKFGVHCKKHVGPPYPGKGILLPEEIEDAKKELAVEQTEMKAFGKFLKDKFFNEE